MGYNRKNGQKEGKPVNQNRIRRIAALLALCMLILVLPQSARGAETAADDRATVNGAPGLEPYWLAPDFAEGDYSIVVLPDTQFMVGVFTNAYYQMMQWIADNRDTLNIQAVLHMGDMVNKNTNKEWTAFQAGTDLLDAAGIPWMPMMGNHDNSKMFNEYFDYQTYGPDRSWFGGSYHADKLDHTYWFITVGQREYLIFSLGWAPSWDVLDWAKGVVEAYPEKNVIVTSHALINKDGDLLRPGIYHNISSGMPGYPDGIDIWNLFREYENLVLCMCGHVGCPDIISAVNENAAGRGVHSLLIDNQTDETSNSKGMIAVLTFRADSNTVELNWYSTIHNAMYGPENQYAIDVTHVSGGTTESEDITQQFTDWSTGSVSYTDGIGFGEPGYSGEQDSRLMYSDFICIEEYDRLELTLCGRKGFSAVGGFAFYSAADPNSFLSLGAEARTGNGSSMEGTVVRTVAVPEDARYIRVTYWADHTTYSSTPFRCVGFKTIPDCLHSFVDAVIPPTCDTEGCTTHTCGLCGYSYADGYVPALGHDFGDWVTVTEAACTVPGQAYRDCGTCGQRETQVLPALGHSMIPVEIPPTCTAGGYSTLTCTRCGYTEPVMAMTDLTDRFTWTDDMAIQATTGKRVSDGNWMASDYVDISEYGSIEIVTANTAASNTVFGLAFYDEDHNFISGIRHTDGSGSYGILVHTPQIPENAVYIRSTWYSPGHPHYQDSFGGFYCLGEVEDYVPPLGHAPGEPTAENETPEGEYDLVTCCTRCGMELSRFHVGECAPGDVNGDGEVNIFDANLVVACYNGTTFFAESQLQAADVNGDGEVDIFDANLIVAYYNGTIPGFPVE